MNVKTLKEMLSLARWCEWSGQENYGHIWKFPPSLRAKIFEPAYLEQLAKKVADKLKAFRKREEEKKQSGGGLTGAPRRPHVNKGPESDHAPPNA